MLLRRSFILLICFFITACANTKIIESWVEPDLNESFKRPLIIGISDSQQTRRIYENHVVEELNKNGIEATPSHTLINSKQEINQKTVVNAIKDTDIDSVLVTYLVSADTEMMLRDSPLHTGYSGNNDDLEVSSTIIVTPGRYNEEETITLKNDLYSVALKTMVWSVMTKSGAVHSIDEVVTDVTNILIKQMYNDGVLQ